ncbi:hypothetical protein [Pontibacter fetidus]|uniref:Uncharacterized protein n=1 Tax=Pontibacter fetidus TaxID=2700082 RepID=A0A6B2GWH4_9BACT|nr:hypothetical protein [Pontibacter fetidus]NDK55279.1 hypothetical protein [Pontibacter fetidus]
MNSVKLSTYYRLYAFSDYQSMQAGKRYLQRVVLAKALVEVQEKEVRTYLQRNNTGGYKNYLEPVFTNRTYFSADRSFISALQLLYKSNGYSARYIVVERL